MVDLRKEVRELRGAQEKLDKQLRDLRGELKALLEKNTDGSGKDHSKEDDKVKDAASGAPTKNAASADHAPSAVVDGAG